MVKLHWDGLSEEEKSNWAEKAKKINDAAALIDGKNIYEYILPYFAHNWF